MKGEDAREDEDEGAEKRKKKEEGKVRMKRR